MRAWMRSASPAPSMMVLFSLVMTTRLARPRSLIVAFSSDRPTSSEITVPLVSTAMSSRMALRRSPKPGAFTAATLTMPRMVLTTRVASASPSTSSATMTSGLPALATPSSTGKSSRTLEIFLSWRALRADAAQADGGLRLRGVPGGLADGAKGVEGRGAKHVGHRQVAGELEVLAVDHGDRRRALDVDALDARSGDFDAVELGGLVLGAGERGGAEAGAEQRQADAAGERCVGHGGLLEIGGFVACGRGGAAVRGGRLAAARVSAAAGPVRFQRI